MSIGLGADPLFTAYVAVLVVTGVGTVVFAGTAMGGEATAYRLVAAVAGLGMLGYGAYAALLSSRADDSILWQAFFAPVVLAALVAREVRDRRRAALDAPPVPRRRAAARSARGVVGPRV
jgi:hypothetical protein